MRVLGIDAGQVRLGLASVDINKAIELDRGSVIFHPRDQALTFNEYLNEGIYQIADLFPQILHLINPDIIVAEIVPVGRLGSNTELNVAAITVCKTIAYQWGIDWKDIAANSVKKIVTGNGKATKKEIKEAVIAQYPQIVNKENLYKEQQKSNGEKAEPFPQDLYDAICVGWAGCILYGKEKEKREV